MLIQGKFGRVCQLSLETSPDATGATSTITIPPQCTVEFSITRQSLSSSQTGSFIIRGLAPATRDAIFKDFYNWTAFRAIQFRAGYGNFYPLIFNGTIFSAYSQKDEGAPSVTTVIEAQDGAFAQTNGFTSGWGIPQQAIPSGTKASDVITALASTLPNVQGSAIVGNFPMTNLRGEVIFGNTWGLIQQKSLGQATIDNGQVKALNLNEVIDGPIPLISSSTGLLGSPRRSGYTVEWDMLFEPRLTLFQQVQIQSTVNPRFNGNFKVMGFTHRGVVSPTEAGPYETTANILFGTAPLSVVAGTLVQ